MSSYVLGSISSYVLGSSVRVLLGLEALPHDGAALTGGALFYVRVLFGPEPPPHGGAAFTGGALFHVRVLLGLEAPPHDGTALRAALFSTFGSYSAPSHLRMAEPPLRAALSSTMWPGAPTPCSTRSTTREE